jgi:hypothetical protein
MTFAQSHERGKARTAIDHVIFGVHFEPQAIGPRRQRFCEVLQFEAETCGYVQRFGPQPAVREPLPLGVWILVQVPAGTSFQAFFW